MSLTDKILLAEEELNEYRRNIQVLRQKANEVREKRDKLLTTQALLGKLSDEEIQLLGIEIDQDGNISQRA